MKNGTVWLFSYGTLRQPKVQLGLFGRELESEPDALPGHVTRPQRVTDPRVIGLSGSDEHPALVATGNANDEVAGWVLAISEAELPLVDAYEAASQYQRIAVRLKSGRDAFAYIYDD